MEKRLIIKLHNVADNMILGNGELAYKKLGEIIDEVNKEVESPNELYSENEQEEIITEIANLREVFDWPKDITDIKSPLYYSYGEIAGSPIGCLKSMISITEYRNKNK